MSFINNERNFSYIQNALICYIGKNQGKTKYVVQLKVNIYARFTSLGLKSQILSNFLHAGIHVYQWLLNVFQAIANTIKVQTVHWMRKKGSAMSLECGHAFSGGVMGGIWCPKFNFFFFPKSLFGNLLSQNGCYIMSA